jgi:flagellar hook-associated protein 3 FlgL
MVARISTTQFYHTGLDAMETHANKLLQIQEQLSSGKRVNRPSDDPVAVSKLHKLNHALNTIDQFVENGRYAKSQLELEDTVLNDATSVLQRARELTIQMMNDTYSPADRQATAQEIDQLIKQIVNLANTKNPEKELLFGGLSSNASAAFATTTVADSGGHVDTYYEYVGDDAGSRFVQIGFDNDNYLAPNDQGDPSRVRIGDRGDKVFSVNGTTGGTITITRPDGDSATVDNNVINVLVNLRDWLQAGKQPPPEIADQLYQGITNISQAQAKLGGRINRIDSQYDALQNFQLALKDHKKNLEEVDVVKATADFTQTQVALQFAQQAFAKVQQLSLFNYLR